MARRLSRKLSEAGRSAQVVTAPAESLPFADDSFDTVVSTLVLCTVSDPDRSLSEIARVLRPGGQLLFLEHIRAEDPKLARWQDRLVRPWRVFGQGCTPNRPTPTFIEASSHSLEELEIGEFPKAPPIVRPLAFGRARAG